MEQLRAACTVSDLSRVIDRYGPQIREMLRSEENLEVIEEFKHLLMKKREMMDPMSQDRTYGKLLYVRKQMITSGVKGSQLSKVNGEIKMYYRELQTDNEYIVYSKVIDALQKLLPSVGGKMGSNRARRAFNSGDIVQHDRVAIADAARDQHGNAAGARSGYARPYALRDRGAKVVILQCYEQAGFGRDAKFVRVLRDLGFTVEHNISRMPSAHELDRTLENAHLLIHICGASSEESWSSGIELSTQHCEIIVRHWKNGLNLDLECDNTPFNADTNKLLRMMHGDSSFTFSDGLRRDVGTPGTPYYGCNTVTSRDIDSARSRGGIVAGHLAFCNIQNMYEGETISATDEARALQHGFTPVLFTKTGKLTMIARKSMDGCGKVLVTGNFTWLFSGRGDLKAGQELAMRNLYPWLIVADDHEVEEEPVPECEGEPFKGVCSILFEEDVSVAFLVLEPVKDLVTNMSDYSLNNPLARGWYNKHIMGNQTVGVKLAHDFTAQGVDPYTRRTVLGYLPLVPLSSETNRRTFGKMCCKYLGLGKGLYVQYATMMVAVFEEKIDEDPDSHDAIMWMLKQCMDHLTYVPELCREDPDPPKLPLKDGLNGDLERISLGGDDGMPVSDVFHYMTSIRLCMMMFPNNKDMYFNVLRKIVTYHLLGMYRDESKRPKWESLESVNMMTLLGRGPLSAYIGRTLRTVERESLFSEIEIHALAVVTRGIAVHDWQHRPETQTKMLLEKDKNFNSIWKGKDVVMCPQEQLKMQYLTEDIESKIPDFLHGLSIICTAYERKADQIRDIAHDTPYTRMMSKTTEILTIVDDYIKITELEKKKEWNVIEDMIAETRKSKEQKEKELREKAAYEKKWADDAVRRKILWDATPRGVPYFPYYTPEEWQERIVKPHWFLRSGQVPGDVNVSPDGTWVSMDPPLNEPNY
ncbi:MAG: hypothetical protein LWX54_03160 [Deltaproteobacteria bacterium]|jgi:hypothetical protein|nr:hypothetical protein [Deltaproteobacteria bacterium]